MSDISIQFHALPEEMISFTDESVRRFGLHVAAVTFHPFKVDTIEVAGLGQAISDTNVHRLVFTIIPTQLGAETLNRFLDQNPDAMVLDLGRLTVSGLKQSWLAARTSDEQALKVWKKVAQKLKSITRSGAIAINPQTGASSKLKGHRFTEGAWKLQARGVSMLPVAGTSVITLGD